MPVALICASHTPLMQDGEATPDTRARVSEAFAALAAQVEAFKPEVIVQFAPDHFNGFFYDLMPAFCVGAGANSLGDWGGGTGPLPVPEDFAIEILEATRAAGFDPAVSYRMQVDHGFVQIWEAMFGTFGKVPIVPIFVNCAAPPVPTYDRARLFGEAVGRFVAKTGKRVLFAASGGLSHDPPVPAIKGAPPEIRERLIDGRNPTDAARELRESRVMEAGRLAAIGQGPCMPLNEEWDRRFMDYLRTADWPALSHLDTDEVRATAGRGANEVLGWVAAFAALEASGPYELQQEFYEAIPGWIAGMAMVAAHTSPTAKAA